ncbi:MAG: glycosyltransferase [Chloroflexi bacterium]|nr:glycosyltransferase [Chloroflexota bacterium]
MCRIAMLSVHTCPLARLGSKDAGGMNVYVRELSRHLGQNGMSVDVFTRRTDPKTPDIVDIDENARIVHLDAGPARRIHKSQVFQHLPEFICSLREFKEKERAEYRLIHSHYWLSGWVAGLLKLRWGMPHIAMFHTLGALKNDARPEEGESTLRIDIERKIIHTANAVVASSEHEKRQMAAHYGADPARIRVVPCGVDLERFRPMDKARARQELGIQARKILLFVGRIEPLKGVDLLLKAVARLDGETNDLLLLILGGELGQDEELTRLQIAAQRLGIKERVSFQGAVDQSRLPLYYNAADICIIPSHYESFSLVAAESLACGTPVIASKVGGLDSVVYHLENGLLVPWRRAEAFSQTIAELSNDEALRKRLAKVARASVQRFGWQSITQQVLEIYDELAESSAVSQFCRCGRW